MIGPDPPLSWARAIEILADFFGHLDLDEAGVIERGAAANPLLRTAALDHFRQVYTAVAGRDYDPVADGNPIVWNGLAALVLDVSPIERARFVDEVLFDLVDSSSYAPLADVIRLLLPLDELVDEIVDRLDHGTDRQRANALAMQYELFGRPDDPRLGEHRRRRLIEAVDRLRERWPGPEAAAELVGFSVPEDAMESR